ncbi:hypothetical protein [Demequina zhanjiangensis]|uniref:Uncharacterized protein n=1 Tax=Demequina zhanjiangensis TaxID=3051659 RepID=A0ABT8G2J4_9MICO|nr:hypothetical protein [Demequina sp. SYSU T00b26]MDN4473371.1 hypothetical protein [Demequina sp. SYSU T00b26]
MSSSAASEERTYFSTIEDAIADWQPPLDNITAIRDAVRGLGYEHVFIPASREFIGLEAPAGGGIVGYVMPDFVSLQPLQGEKRMVPLPVAGSPAPKPVKKAKAKKTSTAEEPPKLCMTCFTVLPATGICAYCE